MGSGTYSSTDRLERITCYAVSEGYTSVDEMDISATFKGKEINNAMNPHGIKVRESRDSSEHPNSLAIILGLDVTGSMGSVPHYLVKQGLPNIMEKMIKSGEPDPQILFLGIGDHECDSSPLQVGQFESSDELLDKWLMDVYLEGGGGPNPGESYLLAWYFAGQHTSIDCHEKRGIKGFLFTIGDEPTLKEIPKHALKKIMGDGQYSGLTAMELLDKAREKYNVFHIHIAETGAGQRQETIDGWKQLMQDNLLIAQRHTDVSEIIAETVLKYKRTDSSQPSITKVKIEETMML